MKASRLFLGAVFVLCLTMSAVALDIPTPGSPASGARYATDAYPGFDNEKEIVSPERKEPRWFSFINGPKFGNAKEQLSYCDALIKEGSFSKARKQLDALVREWPTSPEAPKAQQLLAEVCRNYLQDYEDAFAEYRYLLDFYSLQCDYNRIADELYGVAGLMKLEGKEVMFVRFANTVDVRRAYEACVLHAPGAKWVPEAMLTIASLREDEGKFDEAVQVYENLRNLHPNSEAAKTAIFREGRARMQILHDREYNRSRCKDTIDFMKLALISCHQSDAEQIKLWLDEASTHIEDEAYRGAKFYDSTTRTVRSAINAYEDFLSEYPNSVHADEIRERLKVLKGQGK